MAPVSFTHGEELVLGALTLKNHSVGVRAPEAGTALGVGAAGREGIIGYSIFAPFVVRLDFDRRIMTLSEPGTTASLDDDRSLSLVIRRGAPFLDVDVTLPDGASATIEVVVDLGNLVGVMLNVEDVAGLSAPRRSGDAMIGVGFQSEMRSCKLACVMGENSATLFVRSSPSSLATFLTSPISLCASSVSKERTPRPMASSKAQRTNRTATSGRSEKSLGRAARPKVTA